MQILLFFVRGSKSGGSQLCEHSMCESRKTKTSPSAILAPVNRAVIKPLRSFSRNIITFG